jgi:hypothetical protein
MSAHGRILGAALVLAACAGPSACLQKTDPIAAEQLEIDCRGTPCPWALVAGKPLPDPPTTWEDGDVGLDLSGIGLAEFELKVVLLQQTSRTLDLRAAVVRPDDPSVKLRFELQWFAAGPGVGATFWDRQPSALETTSFDVWESGASNVRRTVLIPSEAAALVFRVVKDSKQDAQVMVGDLTLGHPSGSL